MLLCVRSVVRRVCVGGEREWCCVCVCVCVRVRVRVRVRVWECVLSLVTRCVCDACDVMRVMGES